MPKIDPNCLKNYIAEMKKDRSRGKGYDSERIESSARSIQQGLIQEILQACTHSIRTLNACQRDLPKIHASAAQLIHPSALNTLMHSLKSICNHYYRQTITDRDRIREISQQLPYRPLRAQRVLEKQILFARRNTLPIVDKITALFTKLKKNLNQTDDQARENQFSNQAPIYALIRKINQLGINARQQILS